jgi:hypothetical protein
MDRLRGALENLFDLGRPDLCNHWMIKLKFKVLLPGFGGFSFGQEERWPWSK